MKEPDYTLFESPKGFWDYLRATRQKVFKSMFGWAVIDAESIGGSDELISFMERHKVKEVNIPEDVFHKDYVLTQKKWVLKRWL